MTGSGPFDVLVVGSGASGLAAALSAERAGARVALVTKGTLQSCNSAKAQGGIQAAFARRRLARAPCRGRLALLARDGRPTPRRGADGRGAERDPLARGARRRVHATKRRATGSPAAAARRASGSSRSATGRVTRSRPRFATPSSRRAPRRSRSRRCSALEPRDERLARALRRPGARGGRRSSSPPADAAIGRPRSAASSRPTTRARPAR